jgi:hypothetical protein
MKNLPTVVASSKFDGDDPISNRDAIGFYFDVRLQPNTQSRVAVLFSGTVMMVGPQAFGLPDLGDREATFRMFSEAAIGDFIESNGLPAAKEQNGPTPQIECFSPHFQSWRDRSPASDELIENHLFSHVKWAWKFGQPSWTLGASDLLRLNQPLAQVMRLVRLYDKEHWTLQGESATGATLTPTPSFLRGRVIRQTLPVTEKGTDAVTPEVGPAEFVYVDEARIADLRRLNDPKFDLRKLVALCEELNQCYRAQCYHAVAALTRATIDHIPPVLGFITFAQVANNYAGTQSFKASMRRLEDSARKIADSHLHTPIRSRETLPTRVQVNFSNDLDVLLGEIIRVRGEGSV